MSDKRDEDQRSEQESAADSPDGEAAETLSEEQEERMRALLRGAMRDEDKEAPRSDVLTGVQRKLRERSGGKFYADGWSTERYPPISTYLLTSLLMLGILFVVYAALGSLVGEAVEVKNEPAPVRVIPPQNLRR